MQPIYKIELDSLDITSSFNDRLVSMTVVKHAGGEADTLDIELDDRDSILEIPPKGRKLEVFMGYTDTGVTSLGTYTVDNIVLDWSPAKKMVIRGKSADLKTPELKESRNENYEKKTLGDVAHAVAGRAGLDVIVSGDLAGISLGDMLHQTDESDMNLMTRLSRTYNALFKVSNGKLILTQRGTMPEGDTGVTVTPDMVSSARVTLPDRSEYGTTTAYTMDLTKGLRLKADGGGEGAGGAFALKHPLITFEDAQHAAKSQKAELDRAKAEARVRLSFGDPRITASGNLILSKFRTGMDGTYTITSVEHNYDSAGYQTSVDGELGESGGAVGFGPDLAPVAPPSGFDPAEPDDPDARFRAEDAQEKPEAPQPAEPFAPLRLPGEAPALPTLQ